MPVTTEELLERAARRRIEPSRELLARAIDRADVSLGDIGRRIGPAVGKSTEAVRVKLSKFATGHDRTMTVGFHAAVTDALVHELGSDALIEALALDRTRAEAAEELRELEYDIRRYATALDMAEKRKAQVLGDVQEIEAALTALGA